MKVKNWAWDSATKFLSQIENDLISLKITKSEALAKMQNSNEALYLEGINNSIAAEEWLDNIHFQYNLKILFYLVLYCQKIKRQILF